jgi:hypothetical protein
MYSSDANKKAGPMKNRLFCTLFLINELQLR